MGRPLYGSDSHLTSCLCLHCSPPPPEPPVVSPQSLALQSRPINPPSVSTSPTTSAIQRHIDTAADVLQSIEQTQRSLHQATRAIEVTYQRLLTLHNTIRQRFNRMPRDISPSISDTHSMGPDHSVLVLSSDSSTTSTSDARANAFQRRDSSDISNTEVVRNSSRAITPISVSRTRVLRTGSPFFGPRQETARPRYLGDLIRRQSLASSSDPNDGTTSLGRRVAARAAATQAAPNASPRSPGGDDATSSRVAEVASNVDDAITRLNYHREELLAASSNLRSGPARSLSPDPMFIPTPPTPRPVGLTHDLPPMTSEEYDRLVVGDRPFFTRTSTDSSASESIQSFPSTPPAEESMSSRLVAAHRGQDGVWRTAGNNNGASAFDWSQFPYGPSPPLPLPAPEDPPSGFAITLPAEHSSMDSSRAAHLREIMSRNSHMLSRNAGRPITTSAEADALEVEELDLEIQRTMRAPDADHRGERHSRNLMELVERRRQLVERQRRQRQVTERFETIRLPFDQTESQSPWDGSPRLISSSTTVINGPLPTTSRVRRRGWARLDQDGNEIPTDEEEEYERSRAHMRIRAQNLGATFRARERERERRANQPNAPTSTTSAAVPPAPTSGPASTLPPPPPQSSWLFSMDQPTRVYYQPPVATMFNDVQQVPTRVVPPPRRRAASNASSTTATEIWAGEPTDPENDYTSPRRRVVFPDGVDPSRQPAPSAVPVFQISALPLPLVQLDAQLKIKKRVAKQSPGAKSIRVSRDCFAGR